MTTRTFTINVTANAGATYLNGISNFQWVKAAPLASGVGKKLNDPTVWDSTANSTNAWAAIRTQLVCNDPAVLDFSGGAVDDSTKSFLMVGMGGHSASYQNAGYELSLQTPEPSWVRLSDASVMPYTGAATDWDSVTNNYPANDPLFSTYTSAQRLIPARQLDGAPRADHTCRNAQVIGTEIWYPCQNSVSGVGMTGSQRVYKYDLAYARANKPVPSINTEPPFVALQNLTSKDANGNPTYPYTVVPWTVTNLTLGITDAFAANQAFGCADKNGTDVWWISSQTRHVCKIDTVAGTRTTYTYAASVPYPRNSSWAVITTGGQLIWQVGNAAQLSVLTLSSAGSWGSTGTASYATNITMPDTVAWGAVFHKGYIYMYDWISRTLYRNAVEAPAPGPYFTTWESQATFAPNLAASGPASIAKKVYSRFNIIHNLAPDGADCLVLFSSVADSIYVCRLPRVTPSTVLPGNICLGPSRRSHRRRDSRWSATPRRMPLSTRRSK